MSRIKLKSEYEDLNKYINDIESIFYLKKDTAILHNPYGPAFISKTGYKEYWLEGKYHRLDGPAVIYQDGRGEYYINDKYLTKEEFEKHPERLKFLGKEHLICII